MVGSDFTKDNINAKLNTKLNKWLSLDFNARLAYSVVNGLNSGGDTNDASASNSIINKAITYRPVEPLNASSDDDADETSNTDINPYDRMTGTYKQQRRFRQDYNAGLNWKPFKQYGGEPLTARSAPTISMCTASALKISRRSQWMIAERSIRRGAAIR